MQNAREVSQALSEIAALLEFAEEPRFKIRAYENAAHVVNTVSDLGSLVEQDRLRDLAGIGLALSSQIRELWDTGQSRLLTRLRSELPEGAGELVQVEGMTPRRLRVLHEAVGIRSVADLRAACLEGRVHSLPRFGKKTEQRLLEGSERWLGRGEEAPSPMILARALERARFLQGQLSAVAERVELAGAARRGLELLSELEFVVQAHDFERVLDRVSELRQVLRLDREERVAHLSEGTLLKLHCATREDFGSKWLLATGSEPHLAALRARAAARGIVVDSCQFADEASLYQALGLSFIPPELRSGSDELAEAAHGAYSNLIDFGDVRGFVHCHTTYSDGRNTVLEMAQAAHALGMEYITITDHSPSAHYAGGVSLDDLQRQWDEIDAARELVPIGILRGTESDILADGGLDYPDHVLERFDVVIASIHARHRMDRAAMTERLLRALSLPVFKIWGHALGRILNHRDSIDCDVPAVLDALAAAPGAIEINSDPHRLDLPPEWIPAARIRHIPFVISVDAHSTRGLDVLRYGVTMARRGGVRRSEVLNALPFEPFAATVRPR